MSYCRAIALCLLVAAVLDACSGLMLDRLPRHIPRSPSKERAPEDDDTSDLQDTSFDTSVEKKKIFQDPSQMAPFIMKPTWKAIYPFAAQDRRSHRKRDVQQQKEEQEELASILQDDDEAPAHPKAKRQSPTKEQEEQPEVAKEAEEVEQAEPKESFQDWLRREYYRNMAKSFASMRRKRDGGTSVGEAKRRAKKSVQLHNHISNHQQQQQPTSLTEITDNLRNIEDQLFQDALQVMREGGEDYEDDARRQTRVSNDLSLAYDLETMRNAFFRLKETLSNMESEADDEQEVYHLSRKRSKECPSLDQLTSDCSSLSDIMPDGSLKRLLLRACNWHEVCYTCGKAYGLSSENCDGSFIEQTQTICQNDAPCESTANLLVVPLRQRRVFYKRNNPEICVEDPCVEAFLKEGLAAMEEGLYSIRNSMNRHA